MRIMNIIILGKILNLFRVYFRILMCNKEVFGKKYNNEKIMLVLVVKVIKYIS